MIASIDSSTHVCMVGMLDSLSLKNTKLGLETLELMGYERDRVRSSSTAPTAASGSPRTTSRRSSGRQPDVLVPSDREIPRSVNEGTPDRRWRRSRSEAAQAFRSLAENYARTTTKRRRVQRTRTAQRF